MFKTIANISRLLTGALFIFSGIVKAVDPVGSAIKFEDYFKAFKMEFLTDAALGFGVILCVAEIVLGVMLLYKLRMKLTAWLSVAFMTFFTILTLILAVFNPVSDCGCFGDAIILTNWETFFKNIVIFIPVIVVFLYRNNFNDSKNVFFTTVVPALVIVATLYLPYYCYNNLPIVDFRPYRIGANINEGMKIPDDAEADVWETTFIYKKDGVEKEFTMDNYPWQDSTWVFVDQKSVLVKEGYKPPIHDFILTDENQIEITPQILSNKNYTYLLVSYDLRHTSVKAFEKAKLVADYCNSNGYDFYVVTASTTNDIMAFKEFIQYPFRYLTADQTALKTVIRSNPGLLVLKEGTITNKWHGNNIPDPTTLDNETGKSLQKQIGKGNMWRNISFILILTLIGAFLIYANKILTKKEN
ncbi:MAG: DoxX family protein [Bacteroidales bacterium]|jgi:uncharacterized membrane protein YphA (DoxX/SURF4 family)|nr:DoxX family protein [Bacteroidales bacterium]